MIVIIPMAGEGQRFKDKGYTHPKFLISIRGKPMIQWVLESLNVPAHYYLVVREEHVDQYHLRDMFQSLLPYSHTLVTVPGKTEGAACTVQAALAQANLSEPLVIANSDQVIGWNPTEFLLTMQEQGLDGGIPVFKSVHPKWSYAKTDPQTQRVIEVAEKRPISPWATVGVYYFKSAAGFDAGASAMIAANKRVNGEFYVAPVYNELIAKGQQVRVWEVDSMWSLGTPEDLEEFRLSVCR